MLDQDNVRSGFNGSLARGRRPALLVIDLQRGFTETALSPLASECTRAVQATNALIDAMRGIGSVIFTIVGYDPTYRDMGVWGQKCASLVTLRRDGPACQLDPRLHFEPAQDLVLHKTQASAFFGTPLSGVLAAERCDMLVIAGATTSGCVRASTVDAMQYGYPPFVVQEAVTDRSIQQHESNLVDMQAKYAEVVTLASMLDDLRNLQA
jgi:maleamate amidohydrolase